MPSKAPTHIEGFDEILEGGLPRGRTTLVAGGPGCGKSVLAMEFVFRGAARGEPGVFFSFEQSRGKLVDDFAFLSDRIETLEADGALLLRAIDLGTDPLHEAGAYDLGGLQIQLARVIEEVDADRIALDAPQILFSHLSDGPRLRASLRTLLRWLEEQGVTSIVTAERGEAGLTRHGIEEYISDCVILLDHRVDEEIATRRARVVKYRGSGHSADEHPFLIGSSGLSLMPVTEATLDFDAPEERIPTGVPGLDELLGGEGYHRGAAILVSGNPGAGKTSFAGAFMEGACRREERSLYLAFEESPMQLLRNLRSVGVDLAPAVDEGLLRIVAQRPTQHGLEAHLLRIEEMLEAYEPRVVVVDPFTNLTNVGTAAATRSMLIRLVDRLKTRGITSLFTSLGSVGQATATGPAGISSAMDTWIVLENIFREGGRIRTLHIIKSRGMKHADPVHRLRISGDGILVASGRSAATGEEGIP